MGLSIKDSTYYLPEKIVDNDMLHQENPSWDMGRLMKRVGVKKRHIVNDDETALDLAIKACEKLFAQYPTLKNEIDGLIFCTQSEDYIMPPNSCILHKVLDLPENVFSFDFNLACSGYVYGLFLARGLSSSKGVNNVLLVNADTYSKYIHSQDRSARVLFGDGAAVTWLTDSPKTGIVDILYSTMGAGYDAFMIPAGGCRIPKSNKTNTPSEDKSGNIRTLENIHMDGTSIMSFVNSKVPAQVNEILENNNLKVDDIDLFVFHQASRLVLDYLKSTLQIQDEKFYENLHDIGNTVSASIPIALKDAMEQGRIKKGDKVLVSGFGVGLSIATAIIQF